MAYRPVPLPRNEEAEVAPPSGSAAVNEAFMEYSKHFGGAAMAERELDPAEKKLQMFPANWGEDYRSICQTQRLVQFPKLAPGHPMFEQDGAFVFQRLIQYLRAQYPRYGIKEVITPTVWKTDLWKKSGHAAIFKDDMFGVSPGTGDTMEDDAFTGMGLKPMNCPAHCEMFFANQKLMGYKDLPIRMAEFSSLYR